MTASNWSRHAATEATWSVAAALAAVGLMYMANGVFGFQPVPYLLHPALVQAVPGDVFGYLIDRLQHAGKVIEEGALILGTVVCLTGVGMVTFQLSRRWSSPSVEIFCGSVGWLTVSAVLLPATGHGFFGLNEGFAVPAIWAIVFAVYSVILGLGVNTSRTPVLANRTRRLVILGVPAALAVLSLGAIGFRVAPKWYSDIAGPDSLLTRLPLTPVDRFYIVSKNFTDPFVDPATWALRFGGSVEAPYSLSIAQLTRLPSISEYITMECISNDVGGSLISTGYFTGVPLRDLVARARPRSTATWLIFAARDGYTESLSMKAVESSPEILVAYSLDNSPLPARHGFPCRVLVPGHYGMKGTKWLDSIEIADTDRPGYWENAQGWDPDATVQTMSRFDSPSDHYLHLREVELAGIAYAGRRGISKVEYSTNAGRSWQTAVITPPLSDFCWVQWNARWTPPAEGFYELVVRATDGNGAIQEQREHPSFPSGATGYDTILIAIAK